MAVRKIGLYAENEATLRQKSEPVRVVNQRVKGLIRDLKDTLNAHPEGIGLAAPQINAHQRIVMLRLGNNPERGGGRRALLALINPEITEARNERRDFDGCLSFPGLYAETVRPHSLRVTGLDEWGQPFDGTFEGFDAVLVHHEIDHLEGVLFIDRIEFEKSADLYTHGVVRGGQLMAVTVDNEVAAGEVISMLKQENAQGVKAFQDLVEVSPG
ncbi:MAG: peptide deformylase [Anaerolineae bacterium]|nr:peptide deformylase [Anaerolineae bacterium]